jgi:hypothetical protein
VRVEGQVHARAAPVVPALGTRSAGGKAWLDAKPGAEGRPFAPHDAAQAGRFPWAFPDR